MSSARKVQRNIDVDLMESTAQRLGYRTDRNSIVKGYYNTAMENGRKYGLVVHSKTSHYDCGFDGQEIMADFHDGSINKMLDEVMPEYQKQQLESNYLCVERTINMPDRIRLVVRR